MSARRSQRLMLVAALVAVADAGCAGIFAWGSGGPDLAHPEDAVPAALVRNFGPDALAQVSDRLALGARDLLAAGVAMPEQTPVGGGWALQWRGLSFAGSNLELAIVDGRLVARVVVAEQTASLAFVWQDDPTYACPFDATIGPGTLTMPLGFVVDKLGRMTGQVLDVATWSGSVVVPASATSCVDDPTALIGPALEAATPGAFAPVIGPQLGPAFELAFAVGGSSAVATDTTGTGVLQLAVRGDATEPFTLAGDAVTLAWSIGVEVEAHPCMAPGALPASTTTRAMPPGLLDGASALRLSALERVLQALWLAGAACGTHASEGGLAVSVHDLVAAWPALERMDGPAAVHLEVWPSALPELALSPEGELTLSTGALEVSIWGEVDQASWRLATLDVSAVVHGQLERDLGGHLAFVASRVEVTPVATTAGLIGAPTLGEAAALMEPLIGQLVATRAIVILPPILVPKAPDVLAIVPGPGGAEDDAWILFPP